jgi:hypothetical protein
MDAPIPDVELLETSRALIAESRRIRAELDAVWQAHLGERGRTHDRCLAFLSEAGARLEAREAARGLAAQDTDDAAS